LNVSGELRKYADTLPGREQLAVQCFAEALEVVPIDTISELRARHEKGEVWAGVDVPEGKVKDTEKLEVFEPLAVKIQIIKSATEAASMRARLKIDDVIAAGKMKAPPTPPGGPGAEGAPYGGGPPPY